MKKILFIIDKIELKYFEFNNLVTNFWMIKEFLERIGSDRRSGDYFDPCDPGGTGFDLQDKDNKRCNQCI